MINLFAAAFDYSGFTKKLRRYFSDTAPVYADIELRINDIGISCGGKTVHICLDNDADVKENIGRIIKRCENDLYPKMIEITDHDFDMPENRVRELLFQGFTFGQIRDMRVKKTRNIFVITRFNTAKNSIDYKEIRSEKRRRAHFNRPLIAYRDTILRLSEGGPRGMADLYRFIINNSKIEELDNDDVQIPADSD